MISLFVSQSTLGLGTIIGSEVFNHLIISAACILACKPGTPLKVDEMIFTREVLCYALTMVIFMWALQGGSFDPSKFNQCLSVRWYHGLVLMLFYIAYALLVVYYKTMFPLKYSAVQMKPSIEMIMTDESLRGDSIVSADCEEEDRTNMNQEYFKPVEGKLEGTVASAQDKNEILSTISISCENSESPMHQLYLKNESNIRDSSNKMQSTVTENSTSSTRIGNNSSIIFVERAIGHLTYPLRLLITYTIIDVTIPKNRIYYPVTALVSMAWLGLLAEIMLECITLLGDLLRVSPIIMGFTIGAWGASMPTLWSSVVVARKGSGDMAISNALGANVFSILVGLGLPWFLYPLYIKR